MTRADRIAALLKQHPLSRSTPDTHRDTCVRCFHQGSYVDHLARLIDDFIADEITANAAVTIAKGNR